MSNGNAFLQTITRRKPKKEEREREEKKKHHAFLTTMFTKEKEAHAFLILWRRG